MASINEHMVMLPFMSHGHLIPFLGLARRLHHRTGFKIAIANTPLNIQYLHSTMSTDHQINIIELHFCSTDHGLPPNAESTENLTLDQIAHLFYAFESLKTPFEDLIFDIIKNESKPPLCITSDIFFGWAVDVAKSAGTVNVTFSTCGAYGTLAYMSFWLNLPHRKTEFEEFSLAGFPERCKFQVSMLSRLSKMADGTDICSKHTQPQFLKLMESSAWLCNTGEKI